MALFSLRSYTLFRITGEMKREMIIFFQIPPGSKDSFKFHVLDKGSFFTIKLELPVLTDSRMTDYISSLKESAYDELHDHNDEEAAIDILPADAGKVSSLNLIATTADPVEKTIGK